jgi:hypothetical protein
MENKIEETHTIWDNGFFTWFVGFWEGEGSISYSNQKTWSLSIVQGLKKESDLVVSQFNEIQNKLGGHIYFFNNPIPIIRWKLYKIEEIFKLLKKMRPIIRIRKEEIDMAIMGLSKCRKNQNIICPINVP